MRPMRFAICNEQFEGWAFDRICQFVRSAGYEGLEVAPFTLAPLITDVSPAQRAELKQQAADAGIEILGLHWLLAKTQGFHLTSPDAAIRKRTGYRRPASRWARTAARIRCSPCSRYVR